MKSFDLGGTGAPLHFLHANGYPPDCYKPLLERLRTEYHVFGMLLRPLWDESKIDDIKDWKPFSDDLRFFLSSQPDPVIGVGHSIGAVVTLRAALRDPGKFKALVLIDPVLFRPRRLISWNLLRIIGLGDRIHPLIVGAKKRRRTFDDLEIVYRGYRNRSVFRYMTDENLRIYIKGMTQPTADGSYELVYSPEWEAQIYRTGLRDFDIWRDIPKLEVPTLFIRGAETDTFLEDAARLVKQKQPKVKVEALEKSTHILPLERPKEVFEIMQSFLKSLESASLLANNGSKLPDSKKELYERN
jgi:pimeloyl-ACP methyl ester carboxylesterase